MSDGTWWALGAAATLTALATGKRGSRSKTAERAEQIRAAFQHDPEGYKQIAGLAHAQLGRYGRVGVPKWDRWDPERIATEPSSVEFIDGFWRVWKQQGVQATRQRRAREAARERQQWLSSPHARTLRELLGRSRSEFQSWVAEQQREDEIEDQQDRLEVFAEYLEDFPGSLSVREDGLIEVGTDLLHPDTWTLIGDLPIAMYHGTSTALLPAIRRQGMRPARQQRQKSDPTYSTAAGVYLSLRHSVDVYARCAATRHGGDPVILTVRRTLDEISPDPDDEHLGWGTAAMQFITPWVPVSDIVEWS